MAHPQSTPRGLFAKKSIRVPAGGSLRFDNYSESTGLLAADSTGLKVLAANFKMSGTSRLISANSTGYKINGRYISTNTTNNLTG